MKKFFKFFVPILLTVIFVICSELLSYQHPTLKKSSQIEQSEFLEEAKIISNLDNGLWGKDKQIKLVEDLSIGKEDGDESEVFGYIRKLTLDCYDNIYIADTHENTIKNYNSQGEFIKRIGRLGEGPGEFKTLNDIHWCSFDSLLYVVDRKNHRISQFSLDGTYINGITMNEFKMRVEKITSFENGYFALAGQVIGREKIDHKIIVVDHSFKNILSEIQVVFPGHSVGMKVAPRFADIGVINGNQLYYTSPSEYEIVIADINLIKNKIIRKSSPKMFPVQYVKGFYASFNNINPIKKINDIYLVDIWYTKEKNIPLFKEKRDLAQFCDGLSHGEQIDLYNTDFQFLITIPLPPNRYFADVDSQNRLYFVENEPFPRIIRCKLFIR
jgi:hypothetical protein